VTGDLGFFGDNARSRSDHIIDAEGSGFELSKLHPGLRASLAHFGRDCIHEPLRERRKIRIATCPGVRQVLDKNVLAWF
jgi:hypothetical protein